MEQSISRDQNLKTIIEEISTKYNEFLNVLPVQVVSDKIGNMVISEVTYETQTATVIYNEETHTVEEVVMKPIPVDIQQVVLETTVTE